MPVTHWEWHHLTKYKAWTVRAGLWPAGTGAYVQGVAMLSCEYYAHRADRTGDHRVVQYSLPGAAEALVLVQLALDGLVLHGLLRVPGSHDLLEVGRGGLQVHQPMLQDVR